MYLFKKISWLEIIHVIVEVDTGHCKEPKLFSQRIQHVLFLIFSSGPSCSKLDRAIKQINYYSVDNCYQNLLSYSVDTDLSTGLSLLEITTDIQSQKRLTFSVLRFKTG